MKQQTLVPIQNLTEDQLAAVVARDKVRKQKGSPMLQPHNFVTLFNELSRVKGKDEKDTAKIEKEKKGEIRKYLKESSLGVGNEQGEMILVDVD